MGSAQALENLRCNNVPLTKMAIDSFKFTVQLENVQSFLPQNALIDFSEFVVLINCIQKAVNEASFPFTYDLTSFTLIKN